MIKVSGFEEAGEPLKIPQKGEKGAGEHHLEIRNSYTRSGEDDLGPDSAVSVAAPDRACAMSAFSD